MNWGIVFKKFVMTAITGGLGAIAVVPLNPPWVEGFDPKSVGLVALVSGISGAVWNWWKHEDLDKKEI